MSATEFETICHALHLTQVEATSLLSIQFGPGYQIPQAAVIALRLMVAEGYAPEDVVNNLPVINEASVDEARSIFDRFVGV
jgi:hypothetical protein